MYKEIMIAGALGCAVAMAGCSTVKKQTEYVDKSKINFKLPNGEHKIRVNGKHATYSQTTDYNSKPDCILNFEYGAISWISDRNCDNAFEDVVMRNHWVFQRSEFKNQYRVKSIDALLSKARDLAKQSIVQDKILVACNEHLDCFSLKNSKILDYVQKENQTFSINLSYCDMN